MNQQKKQAPVASPCTYQTVLAPKYRYSRWKRKIKDEDLNLL